MKVIGYWITSLVDEEFPPPQELVTDYVPGTRQRIADYLDAGATFEVYRGVSWCRFFCGHPGHCSELTDGEWVWPADLSHYVRDHSVRLPDAFIADALSKPVPATAHCSSPSIIPDETYWISWCAKHRSNSLRSRIQAARTQADIEVQQIKAQAIADRERQEGLSGTTCQWLGCQNLALAGRLICASCMLTAQWSGTLFEPYWDLRPVLHM